VLHARTAFAAPPAPPAAAAPGGPAGGSAADHSPGDTQDDAPDGAPGPDTARERHLQGCYADIDGLLSTLAVLRRAHRTSSGPVN
jgi:hypothetical protein